MDNLHLKNITIDKSNLFFINYYIKQLIYRDNLIELDFFKFLKDTYLNHKNKKIIYIEKIRQKTNKISNISQTMSSYHQEIIIKEILKK